MADEVNNEERIDEFGQSEWNPPKQLGSIPFYPTGVLGKFFSRFFATKAQAYVGKEFGQETDPKPIKPTEPRLRGDTIIAPDTIKPDRGPAAFATNSTSVVIPQLEKNRRNRYKDYDLMDTYPEVGAAFDIYSDDCTQRDIDSKRWEIEHVNELLVDETNELFENLKLDRIYWEIVRNTVKYGDCFLELVLDVNDPDAGIQRLKILNPNYILRVENEYGYLTDFLQEIPDHSDIGTFGGGAEISGKPVQYITLDKNQIVHFRLFTSDPNYYPYGKSIAALAIRIFRTLRMMEEAMVIYRLSRAPERRIFYVDVGNLPTTKAEMFIERLKEKFKKEKFYNQNIGGVDERYNPLAMDEDFFVPTRSGVGTKIDTLPGAQNLGEVDDVKYFRDKLLAILKVPKDYIVEKDKSPERKANLSQLDVKFSRTIVRVQHMIEVGLEKIAKRHLYLKGYPESLVKKLKINLPDPSDMFTKRKLDLNEQKARVVMGVLGLGLFPKEYIYKEFYGLSDEKIEEYKTKVEKEMESQQGAMMGGMGAPGGGGAPPPTPGAPSAPPNGAAPPVLPAIGGGLEGAENIAPTGPKQREELNNLDMVSKLLLSEHLDTSKLKIINKLLHKKESNNV